jgi:hypothetical protein
VTGPEITEEAGARVAIGALQARYVACIDGGRAVDLSMLFAPDGVLESRITGRQNRGRKSIETYLGQVIASRTHQAWATVHHHITPPNIVIIDRNHARAECYFTAFTKLGIDHWGLYSDDLVLTGESWFFAKRSVSLIAAVPGGWVDSGSASLLAPG